MRELRFQSLRDVLEELDKLSKVSAETTGLWSFYQICEHLKASVLDSMHPSPRMSSTFIRRTLGPVVLKRLLKEGKMRSGTRNQDAPMVRKEGDAQYALRGYKESLEQFLVFEGPLSDHPFYGRMERSEWEKYLTLHAALHLGFIRPLPSVTTKPSRARNTNSLAKPTIAKKKTVTKSKRTAAKKKGKTKASKKKM